MSDLEERARQESRDILNPVTAPTVMESSNLLIELADRIATLKAENARLAKVEKAARPVIDALEEDVAGPPTDCFGDDEAVASSIRGDDKLTFGMIRSLRAALSSTGGGDGLDIKRRPMDFALQETTDD